MAARYHIIIDIKNVPDDHLSDKHGLENFLKSLPGMIGMSILDGPHVIEGIPENPGLTGFVIIDFSHISIHTFTDTKQALIDIFSCKPYKQKEAQQAVLNYFQVEEKDSLIKEVYWA